ncbi:hypothetical protein COO60DRAFT_1113858 [Scenedesmus sp. NREL 46B-D3]|nr:hypothetical protein COO60DRAFT_1113858 [Scenedesmus sp. NREL 46B-D3]
MYAICPLGYPRTVSCSLTKSQLWFDECFVKLQLLCVSSTKVGAAPIVCIVCNGLWYHGLLWAIACPAKSCTVTSMSAVPCAAKIGAMLAASGLAMTAMVAGGGV